MIFFGLILDIEIDIDLILTSYLLSLKLHTLDEQKPKRYGQRIEERWGYDWKFDASV